ncbi:Aliphatic sulfonates import ATP-binding protein SsuB [Pigmentiphaga humi]|uniref:Aliphatic sulfonates import ATP-binding protein SsuB n=1 Tax=Pigmentiphaga humi TaxID=2478468 RepID=A0A3P4AZN5_9BURK|nr:ABC transporter ATP-binding protein [Pigmentiphaga humi]VCU68806.1 Aliphatic sulfonates import ATP-binding protein SsuB [Pigmentiphaga humi]
MPVSHHAVEAHTPAPPNGRQGAKVEIRELYKAFDSKGGRFVALDRVNLSIAAGEFLCIVGPSGCGKSTLIRILAGLETPDSGTAAIDSGGWPVENAMVFQEASLFPWMSVFDNVAFGLRNRGVPASDCAQRVGEALQLVGLSKFHKHYPHQLSGGMKQRAAIARAFVTNPALLLMDEPFAALDAQNRAILQDELVRIWETSRKTVVYVTHSLEEALMLGDRTIIMTAQPGRIKEEIHIPFARPRNIMEISATPEFAQMKMRLWRTLEEEVVRARKEMEQS